MNHQQYSDDAGESSKHSDTNGSAPTADNNGVLRGVVNNERFVITGDLTAAYEYLRAEHEELSRIDAQSTASMPSSDEVDTLDEILTKLENEVAADVSARIHGRSSRSPKSSHAEAKAKLSALLVEARMDELSRMHTGRHYGKDYQDSLDELDEYKDARIKELEKQREA